MNVLIIHAHHEPKSFSSALKDRAVTTLTRLGHTVEVSDLYAMGFDPVSDRRNFSDVADGAYLKQQREERHATEHDGFVPGIAAEMDKVLRADLLVFNFPLWWFGMPATLKGWVDRVLAYGKMYGGGKHYENGFGRGKRALVTITTGSARASFNGYGHNPSMASILTPIQHGVFWYNGFAPVPPFIAYAVEYAGDDGRARLLDDYERYLSTLDQMQPIVLPHKSDFDAETLADRVGRWMVEVRGSNGIDEARAAEFEREGKLLACWTSADAGAVTWLVVREGTHEGATAVARSLVRNASATVIVRESARRAIRAASYDGEPHSAAVAAR